MCVSDTLLQLIKFGNVLFLSDPYRFGLNNKCNRFNIDKFMYIIIIQANDIEPEETSSNLASQQASNDLKVWVICLMYVLYVPVHSGCQLEKIRYCISFFIYY